MNNIILSYLFYNNYTKDYKMIIYVCPFNITSHIHIKRPYWHIYNYRRRIPNFSENYIKYINEKMCKVSLSYWHSKIK